MIDGLDIRSFRSIGMDLEIGGVDNLATLPRSKFLIRIGRLPKVINVM